MTTCDATLSSCVCDEDPDHDDPHVCDCGGSWSHDEDGELVVHQFPPVGPLLAQLGIIKET